MAERSAMTDIASNVSLQDSLLTTKLYIPQPRPERVLRPRLIARLNDALREQRKLTLISAPAGFGKTTLVRDTSQVLARYLSNFNPAFIGLTDDFAKTEAVLKSFWAYADKEQLPEPPAHQNHDQAASDQAQASPAYLVMHTGRLYLVTPQRELWLTYPSELTAEDLQSDLLYLLKQKSN